MNQGFKENIRIVSHEKGVGSIQLLVYLNVALRRSLDTVVRLDGVVTAMSVPVIGRNQRNWPSV